MFRWICAVFFFSISYIFIIKNIKHEKSEVVCNVVSESEKIERFWCEIDTSMVYSNKRFVTDKFIEYVTELNGDISDSVKKNSIGSFVTKFMSNECSSAEIIEIINLCLYNPNSLYYDEKLYLMFLEKMIESACLDYSNMSTLKYKKSIVQMNNVGNIANTFCYYDKNGKKYDFLNTVYDGDLLLLLFFDPECDSCLSLIETLKENVLLNFAINNGLFSVLAIYTEKKIFDNKFKTLPDNWNVGFDKGYIIDNVLYDLKAMPTMYLLDSEKKVVLKDVTYDKLNDYMSHFFSYIDNKKTEE